MKINVNTARSRFRTLGVLMCTSALAVALQAHAGKDDVFLRKAYAGAFFEQKAAQLAEQNASNDQVKLLAHKIATDHQQSNEQLRQIAAIENVKLSSEPANAGELEKLSGLKGEAFDKEFVRIMVDFHKSSLPDYLREAKEGKDIAVKQYASQWLLVVQQNLYLSEQVQAQLKH